MDNENVKLLKKINMINNKIDLIYKRYNNKISKLVQKLDRIYKSDFNSDINKKRNDMIQKFGKGEAKEKKGEAKEKKGEAKEKMGEAKEKKIEAKEKKGEASVKSMISGASNKKKKKYNIDLGYGSQNILVDIIRTKPYLKTKKNVPHSFISRRFDKKLKSGIEQGKKHPEKIPQSISMQDKNYPEKITKSISVPKPKSFQITLDISPSQLKF